MTIDELQCGNNEHARIEKFSASRDNDVQCGISKSQCGDNEAQCGILKLDVGMVITCMNANGDIDAQYGYIEANARMMKLDSGIVNLNSGIVNLKAEIKKLNTGTF